MEKFNIVYAFNLATNKVEVLTYIPADLDDEKKRHYLSAIMQSYTIKTVRENEGKDKDEILDYLDKNIQIRISYDSVEFVYPSYCKETKENEHPSIAYVVVRDTVDGAMISDEMYADEMDAWNKVHKWISEEDLEMADDKPYYVRLFPCLVRNINPFNKDNPFYAKYNFEKMEFDIG